MSYRARLLALTLLLSPPLTFNRSSAEPPATAPASKPSTIDVKDERLSVTDHEMMLAGKPFTYRATAGTLTLKGEDAKPKADVFFVAYERSPAPADRSTRPITFVFNGGPGAASVWLHLGTAGPKRLALAENGDTLPPPYRVEPNPNTWLDSTDLVFIDPVGTGYSRATPGEKPEQFFGVQEDIQWVGEFIRVFLTRYDRWASPKFLAGESYGTTRAAGLSEYLLDRLGVNLNGIILVSTVLNFQTISFGPGDNLPYALFLPTYTATAFHHKKLNAAMQADLAQTLAEAQTWAVNVYLPALVNGASLPAAERATVAKDLARFTGLDAKLIEKADLRVDPSLFRKMLLSDQQLVIGRFDGRITGHDRDPLSRHADFDPSFSQYLAAYTAGFNSYARGELKYESELSYEVLSGKVQPWNFGRDGNGYLDVSDNLQRTMIKNPYLRVFVASGYYDLATPYFATDYTLGQIALPPNLRKQMAVTYYPGGHMMYHLQSSQAVLDENVGKFLRQTLTPPAMAE